MAGKRAESLLELMYFIERFTLNRAWTGLTDDELFWEPAPGSWSIRPAAECRTATPFVISDWIADMDSNEARLKEMRAEAAQSQLEVVGKELRGLMHKAGER